MPIRKTFILFTTVVATVVLFAATQVGAREKCVNPKTEVGAQAKCVDPRTGKDAPFTIELEGGAPVVVNSGTGEVRWTWNITATGKIPLWKVKGAFVTYPDCPGTGDIEITDPVDPGFFTGPCLSAIPKSLKLWPESCTDNTLGPFDIRSDGKVTVNTKNAAMGIVNAAIWKNVAQFYVCSVPGPVCLSAGRSATGAFSSAASYQAQVPAGTVFIGVQKTGICAVGPDQASFYLDCDPLASTGCTPLGDPNPPVIAPEGVTSFCSGSTGGCAECVSIWDFDGFACVEYAGVTDIQGKPRGIRFQQCINDGGTSCDWFATGGCQDIIYPPPP